MNKDVRGLPQTCGRWLQPPLPLLRARARTSLHKCILRRLRLLEPVLRHRALDVFGRKVRVLSQLAGLVVVLQGGGHGIEVRTEGKEQFLYVCAYQNVKAFAKLTLKGETVWEKYAPMDSGVYKKDEDKVRVKRWGRDAFMPTNFAFLNDGGFLLADGYGSFYVHRFDKAGNWVSKFGGPGKGEGEFATPHGIWIDRRPGREERVVVCDQPRRTMRNGDEGWR